MTARKVTGKCLCGAVRFEAVVEKLEVGACHCGICRRWAGGPFMAVGASAAVLSGIDDLGIFQSSEWGERGFCRECGSSLFWRSRDESHYALSVNALQDASDATFSTEIFIDSKPAWYDFANDTKKMTGAEVFAAFAPAQEVPHG
ncbi:GFA family protein [Consotaella salsifontis]|uniref:Uncharacterized conserved protein n=1 Tax=Consotaella salsifontis TaxID=1365950 RepID=A0A1T4LLI5_9HYPH|nr:GFA family protein [Consotaella salsifontis]SJZ55511.1 Uncharacterized conserved protein [Consotaella salsifontis]